MASDYVCEHTRVPITFVGPHTHTVHRCQQNQVEAKNHHGRFFFELVLINHKTKREREKQQAAFKAADDLYLSVVFQKKKRANAHDVYLGGETTREPKGRGEINKKKMMTTAWLNLNRRNRLNIFSHHHRNFFAPVCDASSVRSWWIDRQDVNVIWHNISHRQKSETVPHLSSPADWKTFIDLHQVDRIKASRILFSLYSSSNAARRTDKNVFLFFFFKSHLNSH